MRIKNICSTQSKWPIVKIYRISQSTETVIRPQQTVIVLVVVESLRMAAMANFMKVTTGVIMCTAGEGSTIPTQI